MTATEPCCGYPNSTHYAKKKVNRGSKPWMLTRTEAERFADYVIPEPNSGCFLWVGGYRTTGYGQFNFRGKRSEKAHRAAWVLAHGDIPAGMHVLHHCDNPACVNVAHLFLGTALDNVRDMIAKGRDRNPASSHREKTCCPKGHPYDLREPDGRRRCRACYSVVTDRSRANYKATHSDDINRRKRARRAAAKAAV